MPSIEQLSRAFVYEPRSQKKASAEALQKPRRLGRVHNFVFSPDGRTLVGIFVKRPDVAGMVKREDLFCAWDRLSPMEGGLLLVGEEATDAKAIERLRLDWDRCIIWEAMDVVTRTGEVLGRVTDIVFDEATGQVERVLATDGGMAAALVGAVPIEPEHILGVRNQCMVVADEVGELDLTGGMMAAAGEGFGKARVKGAELASKAGTKAGQLLDQGSFALGRAIGQAKNAIQDAMAPEPETPGPVPAEGVRVEASAQAVEEGDGGEPPLFVVDESTSAKAAASDAEEEPAKASAPASAPAPQPEEPSLVDVAARALGQQLGKTKTMFSDFLREFNEASR